VQADLKHLPFRDNTFNLIIFDPPHYNKGSGTIFGVKFGGLSKHDYRHLIVWANLEFSRVLKSEGYVCAKTIEPGERMTILLRDLSNFKPLLDVGYWSEGGGSLNKVRVHWILFLKKPSYEG